MQQMCRPAVRRHLFAPSPHHIHSRNTPALPAHYDYDYDYDYDYYYDDY